MRIENCSCQSVSISNCPNGSIFYRWFWIQLWESSTFNHPKFKIHVSRSEIRNPIRNNTCLTAMLIAAVNITDDSSKTIRLKNNNGRFGSGQKRTNFDFFFVDRIYYTGSVLPWMIHTRNWYGRDYVIKSSYFLLLRLF